MKNFRLRRAAITHIDETLKTLYNNAQLRRRRKFWDLGRFLRMAPFIRKAPPIRNISPIGGAFLNWNCLDVRLCWHDLG